MFKLCLRIAYSLTSNINCVGLHADAISIILGFDFYNKISYVSDWPIHTHRYTHTCIHIYLLSF